MKRIAILGSTGSIGRDALEVAKHLGCEIVALAAHSDIDLLEEQALYDEAKARELQRRLPGVRVVSGQTGLIEVATHEEADFLISAIVGMAGLVPTLKGIEAGKTVGLANKEALVAAGELMMEAAKKSGTQILPIDSEHSAIFQCLQGERLSDIKRIILTASGGPFLNFSEEQLKKVSVRDALNHPTWKMGKKISVDSSTLMNKGLEVIEASLLFSLPIDAIEVVIHPQSLVHSFVECIDGSLLAQMGVHDMKGPIQYALTYPNREKGIVSCIDFTKYSKLEFFPPEWKKFPCLGLAYEAAKTGGTLPCFMNGANEVLVERFLAGELHWNEIGKKLERLLSAHRSVTQESLEMLLEVDKEARTLAKKA